MFVKQALLGGVSLLSSACALNFVPGDRGNVEAALKTTADNVMGYYNFAQVGVLPAPYYWWETAGLFSSMIEYWHITGDATYNTPIAQAIISQISATDDFMMPAAEGNDDQGWWALAAMSAAEYGLPSPAGAPSWISLAQNVFNDFQSRWDTTRCNGGMRWKISPSADGYHYKSSIANGLAFQLAARLARFTGNQEYAQWASTAFNWTQSVGLIDGNFNVYDGTDDSKGTGCIDVDHDQWSYNVGVFMYGAAVMFNTTGEALWSDRAAGLIGNAVSTFHDSSKIMYEKMCEKAGTCNTDQLSFKAYLSRWMASTAAMIPAFQAAILPYLQSSAVGAAQACTGGGNGQMCGSRWYTAYDGLSGVGQQLAALEVMHGSLVPGMAVPAAAAKKVKRTFVA